MKTEKEITSLRNQNSRNEKKHFPNLIARIEKFSELEQNWDTYGSDKISLNSISSAIQIIKISETDSIVIDDAFPMRDGGVQLEKDFENHSIEIEVSPDNEITLLVYDKESNLIFEKSFNVFEINDLINIVKDYYGNIHHSGKR